MTDDTTTAVLATHIPELANGYRLQFEQAQDNWVLLYPEGMVKLNPSAAEILQRCNGTQNVADITRDLEATFDADDLSKDVQGFLAIAHQQHWVRWAP